MDVSMKLLKINYYGSSGKCNKISRRRRKLKKCVCVLPQTGELEFPRVWEELRNNNQLCDGIVRCASGKEFRIHRAILSAVSPYFKALFTNSINRDKEENTQANTTIPTAILETLLDFAYSGKCNINEQNVESLLRFADQYEILGVVQLCCKFLLDEMCPANCLGILHFAGQYFCTKLMERGKSYVRHHFVDLLSESCEFVNLTISELSEILKDDELNIKSEEIVFDAIKKWVNFMPMKRRVHLLELLKCMRLHNLEMKQISKMSKWSLIQKDPECKQYMTEAQQLIHQYLMEETTTSCDNYSFRPRIPYEILFAIGGWSAGSPTNFIEIYDIRADRWLLSTDTDSVPRAYHGLCSLRGLIYMVGGFDGNEYFNTMRCFNPVTHEWSECACMYYPRCYVSVVMHDERIYALGGYNGRVRMNTVERYSPDKNQWELIPSMLKQRSDASAAVLNSKIYIVGGFNGQEVMCSAEMFDISTSQWSYIPHMSSARSGVSLVAFKNALYAIGGFNGYTRLTTGEKFMPESDTRWTEITEMMTPRSNFATITMDDFIYIIGGFNGSTTINYVEYYDPESNEWLDASSMNLNRSALSVCVVSGLPNSREYSFLGRLSNGDTEKDTKLQDR
ncbi:kelch-like protein 10 isoform X2 [Coccinella septempunctata]|uniref:kelch-like protein 10 isoform X2 n=1 Tax=Coccinella septempunctata TaxID=41139 RepID=UPI001D07FEA3|nr:kelch-like protein 10 isoform X2 [Coccinella septempunctata]